MTETTPDYVYESMNDADALPGVTPSISAVPTHTEAPAVIFTQLYAPKGGQIVQFNLTCRANSAREAIDQLVDGINYAKTKGFSVIRPMGDTPPAMAAPQTHVERPASPVTAPASNSQAAPAIAQNGANNTVSGQLKTIRAVRMDVMPKPDGKVTLEWYMDGHKFADIYTTRTLDNAVNLLLPTGAWTADHLKEAQTYSVRHVITWRDSEKLNSKGNPYKDLVSITAE